MASPTKSGIFQTGIDVLASIRDAVTKTILLVTGDNANEFPETDGVELWGPFGLQSRPPNPDPKKVAAQVITIRRGDHDLAIGGRDLRGQELAGNLQPGETCLYAAGADGSGQGRVLIKGDSSVNLYTAAGAGANGVAVMLNPAEDKITSVNAGGAAIILSPDSISLTIGAAALTLSKDGSISLVGTGKVQIDGTSIVLGSVAVPGVNSALTGVTGIAGVASTKVLIET